MKKLILTLVFIATGFVASAQVGIGTTDPDGILDVVSTDSGVILPRVASTAAVTAPIDGMMIYDVANSCIKSYEGGAWSACFSAEGSARTLTVVSTGGSYDVLPSDDIVRYIGSGGVNFNLPSSVPLGTEFVLINNASDGFSLLTLPDANASTGSNNLSANAGTTVIHLGGGLYAALHSY
jgi:hypothetical protein